jgi:hypothetical protein
MASQVPYSGTQDVAPQQGFLPAAHEDTPIAAFGGATAGAITHMGEVAQGAGKELFDRAYAFQELAEQTKADSASADVFDKQTQRYLQFEQLKGAERTPEAYQQYVQDLGKIRNDGAEGLNSPYAKMQYLRDSRRNQSMMIWHGGMLARQGQDEALKEAGLAKIDSTWNSAATVGVHDGPELAQTVDAAKRAAADHVHIISGFAPGTKENNDLAAPYISHGMAKVVIARSNADPVDGKAFADEMLKAGTLSQEDYDTLKPRLDSAVLNKTSAAIAHGVVSGYGPDDKPTASELEAKARTAAEKADPGNKDLADQAVIKAESLKNLTDNHKFLTEKQERETLIQTIDGTNSKDGKVPVSLDAAMAANPEFKSHYLELSPQSQISVQNIIRRNQEVGGVVHNPTGDLQYYKMMEIATGRNSTSTPEDLREFAEADLLKPPYDSMTREQRSSLLKAQGEVINNQVQNPNMTHALTLGSVQGLLKQAGIDKASNPDEYAKFQTAYHDAVVGYGLGAERSVKNDKELTDIATGLINKQSGAWFAGLRGINTAQPYQSIIDTSKSAERVGRTAFRQQYGREPDLGSETDKKLTNDLAMRMIYMKYGQQSTPAAPRSTSQAAP